MESVGLSTAFFVHTQFKIITGSITTGQCACGAFLGIGGSKGVKKEVTKTMSAVL